MATKRPAPRVHPSRQDQVPDEPKRKRQKPDNAGPKSFKKAHPVNELKSQVRSLKRLLERNEDLPANVRVEKERALQSTQHELAEAQKAKEKSDMIGKYHKIRFFERQKAIKRLKKARKELKTCEVEAEREDLATRVHDSEVDVNYAMYYPLDQPYVSLFPRKKDVGGDADVDDDANDERSKVVDREGDAEMWQRVKQCMQDGTLDALRNGKLAQKRDENGDAIAVGTTKSKGQEFAASRQKKEHSALNGKSQGRSPSDDESDGGFFE